ncbi:3694_t:CDS:2, partial [Gigaspora rosea]
MLYGSLGQFRSSNQNFNSNITIASNVIDQSKFPIIFNQDDEKSLATQQQFINGLEELLTQLVSSDTDTARIRTATSTLNNEYYNSASCVPAYVHILSSSPSWQVRQLAAVELRKRGPKWWSKIDANSQSAIKSRLLEIILQEP